MKNDNFSIKLFLTVLLIFGVTAPFQVFATYPATPYASGETLAPSCAPGSANCTVTLNVGIASLDGLTGVSQTFSIGTSGTDFNIDSAGTIHTFNIPSSSATKRGLLSSADWNTFNGKQNALGFTPYNATNPAGYQTASDVSSYVTGLGYQTAGNVSTYVTGLGYQTASDVSSYVTGLNYLSGVTEVLPLEILRLQLSRFRHQPQLKKSSRIETR